MVPAQFEEIEHTADLALRVYGGDLKELFGNAACGMFSLMADVAPVRPQVERRVSLESMDYEALLVDWLNELLYMAEEHGEIYCEFTITALSATEIVSQVRGMQYNSRNLLKQIKAVTFHDLDIKQTAQGYTTTIVFDV
jgi:SHS2 domain-containing protein